MQVFIPGNVPSSKNSKQWTGKYLISSKQTHRYVKATKKDYEQSAVDFKRIYDSVSKPARIEFHFIRDSRRRFDFCNAVQIVQDLMVKHGWIDDDNAYCIIPVFREHEVDKDRAGVLITLL